MRTALFNRSEVAEIVGLLTADNVPTHVVAVLLNVDRLTLARWRQEQTGPPFVRLKRGVVAYPREAFQRYLKFARQPEIKAQTGERRVSR